MQQVAHPHTCCAVPSHLGMWNEGQSSVRTMGSRKADAFRRQTAEKTGEVGTGSAERLWQGTVSRELLPWHVFFTVMWSHDGKGSALLPSPLPDWGLGGHGGWCWELPAGEQVALSEAFPAAFCGGVLFADSHMVPVACYWPASIRCLDWWPV